jgi:hypothetical protein
MNCPSIVFIRTQLIFWMCILFNSVLQPQTPLTEDRLVCNKIFSFAFEQKLIEKPMGRVITTIGQKFLGKPYAGGTLDSTIDEHLVVNLRGFDCVTFIENVLALSRAIKSNTLTFDAYKQHLQAVRYRSGIINGYSSRLNYFSEWITDNQKKRILADVTKVLGGIPYRKTIHFMTGHRSLYKQLGSDSVFTAIGIIEKELSALPLYYIPKRNVAAIESRINDGDIIAITTNVNGLDISHTGIAIRNKDGSLHLLHAPDTNGIIRVTAETLSKHLLAHKNQTGIVVARPTEPGNENHQTH